MQALSREPKLRQQTARELALQLEKCAGIASPTEVGEWVEAIVGPTLSAREEQIAAIESSSAALRVNQTDSGRPVPQTPDDSSSDVSAVPSSRDPYGMIGQPSSGRYPLSPLTPVTSTAPLYPPGATPAYAEQGPGTGSGTKLTGSMSLPVDRKLPVLGILAGLTVLLVVMAVVVAGRLEEENKRSAQPTPSGSVSGAISGAMPDIPPPPPPPSSETSEPSATPTTPSATPAPAQTSNPVTAHPAARPTQAPAVRPTQTATATTKPPAKNCDPPWIIDDKGHRQYKRECL
jgi:serine/threonine-protein kinase